MSDKKELKEDFVEDKSDGGKLVSRSSEPVKALSFFVVNNTTETVHFISFDQNNTIKKQGDVNGGQTSLGISMETTADYVKVYSSTTGKVVSAEVTVNSVKMTEYTNEEEIIITASE